MVLDAFVGRPDGSVILRANQRGNRSEAAALGRSVAAELLGKGAGPILQELIKAAKSD